MTYRHAIANFPRYQSAISSVCYCLLVSLFVCSSGSPAEAQRKLVWGNDTGIFLADLNGANSVMLLDPSSSGEVEAIAVDDVNQKIYFSSATYLDRILRMDFDGSNLEHLFLPEASGRYKPLWIDSIAGKLYWTDGENHRIHRANLDLTNPETIVENIEWVKGITGSHKHGKIYFMGRNTRIMQRANLDGTEVEDLMPIDTFALHLAIDLYGGKLYSYHAFHLWRSNLDGSNEERLPTGFADGITGLAIDAIGRKVYWGDIDARSMYRANLDGTGKETLITSENRTAWALAILPDLTTGHSVSGTILQDELPVVNAKVILSDNSSASVYEATTDSNGSFTARNVLPGTYGVTADKNGTIVSQGTAEVVDTDLTNVALTTSNTASLSNPAWIQWNTFLEMTNVVEIVNKSDVELTVTIENYTVGSSQSVGEQSIVIPANSQVDVIVNDFPGTESNSYGIFKLTGSHSDFDGRVAVYRPSDSNSEEFSYTYSVPFSNPQTNKSYVLYNTFQPSVASYLAGVPVTNWLSLTNLSAESQSFTVYFYNQAGQLAHESRATALAFSRVDIDGGHESVGANSAGLIEIVPEDPSASYLAMLARYSLGDSTTGDDAFSLSQLARNTGSAVQFLPVMNVADTWNFIEVGNTSPAAVAVTVGLYSTSGVKVSETPVSLPGHGVRHINAREILGGNIFGTVKVEDSTENAVLSYGLLYRYGSDNGQIVGLEYSEGRESLGQSFSGSYNTFLGMSNWLRVLNVSDEDARITVEVKGSTPSYTYPISAMSRFDLELNREPFNVSSNLYGLVSVSTEKPGQVISEIIRLKPTDSGMLDSSMSSVVR